MIVFMLLYMLSSACVFLYCLQSTLHRFVKLRDYLNYECHVLSRIGGGDAFFFFLKTVYNLLKLWGEG